jgi:predicted permease
MAPSAQAGLIPSFVAAIQASLSVLLVISYGAIAAHLKLLDPSASKSISKICVRMFLPALLLTQIGSELHSGSAHRYLIILVWATICHLVSFFIGIAAHYFLGMPDWITAAIMFNNTTSYPLLLIQSLDQTGILGSLIMKEGETTRAAIERAKSYFLVFATVSSCLTFAVGPRLIDSEHGPDSPSDKEEIEDDDEGGRDEEDGGDADDEMSPTTEHTGLLFPRQRQASVASMSFYPSRRQSIAPAIAYDRRPSVIARKKWVKLGDRTKWWLLFLFDFLNAPLLGAVLGAIIGLVPTLHVAFFSDTEDGGIFTAWLTESFKNIGSLFVPLPVVVAGVSLYMSTQKIKSEDPNSRTGTPWLTTLFVLAVRFVVWSVASIGVVYILAKKTDALGEDPMLWFAMMLMPT